MKTNKESFERAGFMYIARQQWRATGCVTGERMIVSLLKVYILFDLKRHYAELMIVYLNKNVIFKIVKLFNYLDVSTDP